MFSSSFTPTNEIVREKADVLKNDYGGAQLLTEVTQIREPEG